MPADDARDLDSATLPPELQPYAEDLHFTWDSRPVPYGFEDDPTILHPFEGTEDRRLWRRRALIHAAMRRADEDHDWSASPRWHDAAGWLGTFDRPFTLTERPRNTYAGSFSRELGRRSAALDLATFAEEALAPVDAPPDDRLACREFSKSRALAEFLHLPPPDPAACPAFQRWARLDALSHAEVLFVTPSGRAPESLFGHLALRLVHDDPLRVEGPDFGVVVQPVALSGTERDGLAFAWHGLTGDYALATLTVPLGDVLRQSALYEQRTIRRFRLNLERDELERLLERVWEAERFSYPSYFFFSENCASELIGLIDGAVSPERHVGRPGFLYVSPAATLDALAPLLEPIDEPLPSSLDRVRKAHEQRRSALARLPPDVAAKLPPADAVPTRADLDTIERAMQPSPALYAWLRAALDLSHAAAEVALARKIALHLETLAPDALPATPYEQATAQRQADFARESDLQSRRGSFASQADLLAALERAPHRAMTDDEQRTLAESDAAIADFRALARRAGDWIDRYFPNDTLVPDAPTPPRTIRASGLDQVSLGFTWNNGPALTLRGALAAERLGDQRADGLSPAVELRVLDGAISLVPHALRTETLTLLSFRTLARPPVPLRTRFLDWLGWGTTVDTRADSARFTFETLLPIDEGPNLARFTALSFGVIAAPRWGDRLDADLGGFAGRESRIPLGDTPHSLRITTGVARTWSPRTGWRTTAEARFRAEFPLSRSAGWGPVIVVDGGVRGIAEAREAWGGVAFGWR